jgi:hypothetical protein
VSVTSITDIASGSAMSLSDIEIDTNAGIIRRKLQLPFWSWGPFYTVVYVAGYGVTIPPAVNLAGRIILGHLWSTQRGPAAPVGFGLANPDMTVPQPAGYAIPNQAAELLAPYAVQAYV